MPLDRTIGNYHDSSNARIRKIGRITGPTAYVLGGEALTPAQFGLGRIEALLFTYAIDAGLTTGYGLVYNYVTSRVVWYNLATGGMAVPGANLSGFSARFEAIGI